MNCKNALSILLTLCLLVSVCGGCVGASPTVSDLAVLHEPEFGGIYLDITIDDFNAHGFAYGDSVSVTFSNGYTLTDLPYYNGYYTKTGEPLVVAYPGYPHVKVCINNGDDLWEIADIEETATATVSLHARSTYRAIQDARDIHYTDERSDYDSDEIFANFRTVSAGAMKENVVFRAASPCDNQHNRATYVDALIKKARVRCIINLADNEEKINGYLAQETFACAYFRSLYAQGQVLPLAMNMNFTSAEFRRKAAKGLTAMAENDGPFLIHCTEGKDRTGFMCMLVEALCGASYQENGRSLRLRGAVSAFRRYA